VGTLTINATMSKGEFDLCVEESWSTEIKWAKDITAGQSRDLGAVGSKPVCAHSVHGFAEMLLHAIDTQLYMTTFKYNIVAKH
jgi:hypothetical protein